MNPITVLLTIFVGGALAQLPPTFFSSSFSGGFQGFPGFGSPQIVGSPFDPASGGSSGRSNTGTTIQGPILFPPAPESRDTSGVVVGASGYGFVPPGVNEIVQGRGFQSSSSFQTQPASTFPSQASSPFQASLRQSFGNYFQI